MGESANLSLILILLTALFALAPKLTSPGQIVVASLSTTFIAVVFWKISHYLGAKHMTVTTNTKNVCAQPSSSSLSNVCVEE